MIHGYDPIEMREMMFLTVGMFAGYTHELFMWIVRLYGYSLNLYSPTSTDPYAARYSLRRGGLM